jgi:NitT/TauT family transport system permease protein
MKNKTVQTIIWLLAIIAVWELTARAGLVNEYLLPPFSAVAANFVRELFLGNLGLQALNSLLMVLEGFAISIAIAAVVTLLCVAFPPIEGLFGAVSTIMNPLPSVAVMPLIIMWFGITTTSMLVIIVHGVLWALVRNMLDGVHAIPPIQIEWGRNLGLTPWRMFRDIMVFALIPALVAAMRIGWGRAWRAVISAEMVFGMIGTLGGVGYYIYMARTYARITDVFAGLIAVVVIGMLVETLLFGQIEKRTVRKWGMTHE